MPLPSPPTFLCTNLSRFLLGTFGALLCIGLVWPRIPAVQANSEYSNACCSFPCLNGGICVTNRNSYSCDCTLTGHTGINCEEVSLFKRIVNALRIDKETVQYIITHYSWLWSVINNISPIRRAMMKYIYLSRGNLIDSPPRYETDHAYITLDAYYNASYYALSIPPVPKECPTPMGVAGRKELPPAQEVANKFFKRTKFIPEPYRSNLIFNSYAQHFTHQYFKTDFRKGPGHTWGGHGIDCSHVYGKDPEVQRKLRSFVDGKLKTQIVNGEEYPPYLKDAHVPSTYPNGVKEEHQFALGHPFFAFLPGLFVYSTIWIREHNRVCDILVNEHPEWDDERIYQTARLILIGETIKITIEDYVQHLSQYKFRLTFEPELSHDTNFQYANRIFVEFNHLYHWHPLTPNFYNVSGEIYPLENVMFNVDSVLKHGLTKYVDAMLRQRAGKLSHHNHPEMLLPILKSAIDHGRTLRLQSFNNYRKEFGLKAYSTFEELTGEKEMAADLEKMYGSVDAVEYVVGMFLEQDGYTVTTRTMVEIGGPYSVKGLIANPICSPGYWKPSTFGGEVGFDIIKTATLQKLFCLNLKGECPPIAFTVPDDALNYINELSPDQEQERVPFEWNYDVKQAEVKAQEQDGEKTAEKAPHEKDGEEMAEKAPHEYALGKTPEKTEL